MDKIYYDNWNNAGEAKPYVNSQYESLGSQGKFTYKENVEARYIEHTLPEYNQSKLIRALPPILDHRSLITLLERRPIYSAEERQLPPQFREHMIYRIGNECLFILRNYVDLYAKITIVLYNNLIDKKIGTPEFIRTINYNSDLLRNKGSKIDRMKSISSSIKGVTTGFSVIGISGGGKSTAINNILSLFPQSIIHKLDNGGVFKQLTYIKIDCSHDGSLKGICNNFILEVDSILGSNYGEKHIKARTSIDDLIAIVAHITQLHAVGMIIIDEIQHMSNSKVNAEKALNFFVTLQNVLKIPIVYIGTYKAISKVLGQDYRQARRAAGIGEIHWNHMEKDIEYYTFVKKLWKYQWVKNLTSLSDELMDHIYSKTMGITDRIVKLFMAIQLEAILSRKEKLDKAIIDKVADRQMALTKPMIDALKEGDIKKICVYEDLYSVDFRNIQSDYHNAIEGYEEHKKSEDEKFYEIQREEDYKKEICESLFQLDAKPTQAMEIAQWIIESYGMELSLAKLRKLAIEKYFNSTGVEIEKKPEKLMTGYDNLLEENWIKDDEII